MGDEAEVLLHIMVEAGRYSSGKIHTDVSEGKHNPLEADFYKCFDFLN